MFGIKLGDKKGPGITATLKRISGDRIPVRMEIESARVRLRTMLGLRRGMILVARPASLGSDLSKGDLTRFRIPWDQQFEIEMPVLAPLINLSNGGEAFLCRPPSGRAKPARRVNDRFNTSRYRNLFLELPVLEERFPVLDISAKGCRVEADAGLVKESFGFGRRLWQGTLHIGGQAQIELSSVIPRAYLRDAVGLSFATRLDARQNHLLTMLLGTLAMQESYVKP